MTSLFPFTVALVLAFGQHVAEEHRRISAKLVPHPNIAGALLVDADLGAFAVDTKAVVLLEIENATGREFRLSDLAANCACRNAEIDRDRLAVGDSSTLRFDLIPPKKAASAAQQAHFFFNASPTNGSNDTSRVQVTCRYTIRGLLNLTSPLTLVEFGSDQTDANIVIPFVWTPPVEASRLEVKLHNLPEIDFQPKEFPGGWCLVGSIPRSSLPESSRHGEVLVRDPVTGRQSTTGLLLRRVSPIAISPTVAYMRRNADSFQALFVVRFSDGGAADFEKTHRLTARAVVGDVAVNASTRVMKLGADAAKVIVSIPAKALLNDGGNLREEFSEGIAVAWELHASTGPFTVKSELRFSP